MVASSSINETSPAREHGLIRGDPLAWIGLASCMGALVLTEPLVTMLAFGATCLVLFVFGAGGHASRRRQRVVVIALATAFFATTAFRASRIVSAHEKARAELLADGSSSWPARCQVTGSIVRSPIFIGGSLRIEILATSIHCRDGPDVDDVLAAHDGQDGRRVTFHFKVERASDLDFARGDLVVAMGSVAPPYRFWNDGVGDPRPSSARRGSLLSGGAEDVAVLRRGTGGVANAIDRVRARIRQRILVTYRAGPSEAMARALVLGEDDLEAEDQRAFRKSGLAHLLAVSGMHLVLVVMGFVALVRALLTRVMPLAARVDVGRIAAALGLPVAWLYAELAGGSGSAIRAAWMCSVVLLARALGRRGAPWRALGLSMLLMSLLDPLVVFDISFVLSALATVGLLSLGGPIETGFLRWGRRVLPGFASGEGKVLRAKWVGSVVVKPLATTMAATIACGPVLALLAPELPLLGLVANVIAIPVGEALALPLCLVHVVLVWWPAAEMGCAMAAGGALALVRVIARAFAWSVLPVPAPMASQLGVIVVLAIVLVHVVGQRPWQVPLGLAAWLTRWQRAVVLGAIVLVIGLEGVARSRGSPKGVLRVTFLDVGQGDSALIDLPDGSAMLVDGGGLVGSPLDVGERVILPVLAARRRSGVDIIALSHPHPDHFLGLNAVLVAKRPPHAFWDTGQGENEGGPAGYVSLLAKLQSSSASSSSPSPPLPSPPFPTPSRSPMSTTRTTTPTTTIERPATLCGQRVVGGVRIEVLAPCPGPTNDRNANDNSLVMRLTYGRRSFLLVGDAEHAEEDELRARYGDAALKSDVLKVGHHGSRTSSTAGFLDAVRPSYAVISCGVRNRFGHPHAKTMATLSDPTRRINVLRTDRSGSVMFTTNGDNLILRTAAPEP